METVGALGETIVFLDHFRSLPDPRPDPRQRGKVIYPLEEVLLLCLLAVLAGAESDIARFGTKKRELLRRFRLFTDGTPSHDQLGDIFTTLDAEKFQQCFVAWVAALTGASADVIAAGRCVDPTRKRAGKLPSIWFRPSQRDSGSCSARSKSRRRDRGDPQIAGHVVDRRRHSDH